MLYWMDTLRVNWRERATGASASTGLVGAQGTNREGVYLRRHHLVDGIIDRAVTFDGRHVPKTRGDNNDVEMSTSTASTGVTRVSGAIVLHFDGGGSEAAEEEGFDLLDTVHGSSFADWNRDVQALSLPGSRSDV